MDIEDPDEMPEVENDPILQPGDILDGYKVVKLLGRGGLGEVYEAEDTGTARRVALKILLPEHARKGAPLQRFKNEGLYMGRLRNVGPETHPFPEVYRAGEGDVIGRNPPVHLHYLALEFFSGEVLDKIIEKTPGYRLGVVRAIGFIAQVLEALKAMHGEGIVHRDLKPDNLMIVREGDVEKVKVLDLGIARSRGMKASMTRTGVLLGTPYYMSPEQASSGKIDHRSDLYTTGVIMFEAIAGKKPFDRDSLPELIANICHGTPAEMPDDIDPRLQTLIRKAMARDPSERFQSAEEFRVELLKVQELIAPSTRALRAAATVSDGSAQPSPVPVPAVSLLPPPPASTPEPPAPEPPSAPRARPGLSETAGDGVSVDTAERDRILGRHPRPLLVVFGAAILAAVVAAIVLWPSSTPTRRRPTPVATSDRPGPVTPIAPPEPVPVPPTLPTPPTPVATPEPAPPAPVVTEPAQRSSHRLRRHRREEATEPPTCVRTHVDEESDGTPIYAWRPIGCVRR